MKSAFLTLAAFTLTLFTSALLLFMVQPMVGKLILPLLGGTPAVWNTCMVFFQALLLGGYSYAHFSTKYLGVRRQSIVHLALMMIPFLFVFPITIHEDLLSDTESFLIPKLLGVLFLSAGIPFFIVSASAPLLQRWFSRTGHPAASDPYFLYAASNLGSMIALIGYPAFVEPYLTLEQQRWGWGMGYGVLVLFTGVCAWLLRIAPDSVRETSTQASNNPAKPIPQSIILRWIFLGAVPSSLMLGATTYMTTDIAAIPLLWVAPLAIYLLSFILVFARIPAGVHFTMILLMPLGVLLLLFLMLSGIKPGQDIMNLIGVHLAVLFLVSMVCHGELARSRPAPENLTSFYLYMSLGGVVGGLFNGLLAPMLFPTIAEYQVALVVACMLVPPLGVAADTKFTRLADLLLAVGAVFFTMIFITIRSWDRDGSSQVISGAWLFALLTGFGVVWATNLWFRGKLGGAEVFDLALPAAFGVLTIGLNLGVYSNTIYYPIQNWFSGTEPSPIPFLKMFQSPDMFRGGLYILMYGVPCILCYTLVDRPMRFALGVASVIAGSTFAGMFDKSAVWQSRGFFGALKIEKQIESGVEFTRLLHGTTLHGMQPVNENLRAIPLTYYHRTGPIGQVLENYGNKNAKGVYPAVAVIGLGTGTLATYAHEGQQFDFYDIDPLVKDISFDEKKAFFHYTQLATERGAKLQLILGDARVTLQKPKFSGTTKYSIIAVDAFSSDAIPVHLLTNEAMSVYLDRLTEDGIIVFHVSNRYLRLEPVLANLAEKRNMAILVNSDSTEDHIGKSASTWVALARKPSDLSRLMGPLNTAVQTGTTLGIAQPLAIMPFGPVSDLGTTLAGVAQLWEPCWLEPTPNPNLALWTDDYSNILGVFSNFKISPLLIWLLVGLLVAALVKAILLFPLVHDPAYSGKTGGEALISLLGESITSYLLLIGVAILVAVPCGMLLDNHWLKSSLGINGNKILVGGVFASLDLLVQLGMLGSSQGVKPGKARLLSFCGLLVDLASVGLVLFLNKEG